MCVGVIPEEIEHNPNLQFLRVFPLFCGEVEVNVLLLKSFGWGPPLVAGESKVNVGDDSEGREKGSRHGRRHGQRQRRLGAESREEYGEEFVADDAIGVAKGLAVHRPKMRLIKSNETRHASVPATDKRGKKGWVHGNTLWGGEQD